MYTIVFILAFQSILKIIGTLENYSTYIHSEKGSKSLKPGNIVHCACLSVCILIYIQSDCVKMIIVEKEWLLGKRKHRNSTLQAW